MLSKKIFFLSTSYLLDKNKLWKNKNFEIEFGNYFDFSFLTKKKVKLDFLVLLIFYDDLLNKSNTSTNSFFSNIFKLVESFLENNNCRLIITILDSQFLSPLHDLKDSQSKEKLILSLKRKIFKLSNSFPNIFYFDVQKEFSYFGLKKCFDIRNWYFFKFRFSLFGLEIYTKKLFEFLNRIDSYDKKVLVLDCDNTLWGGIVGQNGYKNLELGTDGLGQAFIDFQKTVLEVKNRGILLSICSKNELKDVQNVFKKNQNMILKLNDIIEFKVNWKNKYSNIIELSQDLNLNLDSFVFWDDNPLEREEVRFKLPKVQVIDVPQEVEKWPSMLRNNISLIKFNKSSEDSKKTKQYQARRNFKKEKESSSDIKKFIKDLRIKPKVAKLSDKFIHRASQMTIKTNQFNFRTQKYTVDEMKDFVKSNKTIGFIASIKDKFGDHGTVGLAMLEKINNQDFFLKNYLISCRILGRKFEFWFLGYIFNFFLIKKKNIIIEHLRTDKNILLKDFFLNFFKKSIEKKRINLNENFCFKVKLGELNNKYDKIY